MPFLSNDTGFEKKCYLASHNWFIDDGHDYTVVNKVSIGRVIQLQVFEKLFESSQVNSDGFNIKSLLKKFDLEWTSRAIFSLLRGGSDNEKSDFLFVYDVNNDPMIQALNIIGLSLENMDKSVCAVTVDDNISKKCTLSRKVSWFKYFSFNNFLLSLKQFFELKNNTSKFLENSISSLTVEFGLKKAEKIQRYYKLQSLQVIFEIMAISSLLKIKKPKAVVLASDAHRVSRIFVFLCKVLSIRTVVYQHGATVWEYGYIPVYADKILIWGRSSREWFESRGVDSTKLIEIGNLRSDRGGHATLLEENFYQSKTIYFFPNPIDREVTANTVAMLLAICRRYALSGVIKLHPSEKNFGFFNNAISNADCSICISTSSMAESGIKPGDIAIVVNSTAGIDCCFQGAYILNVEVGSMPNPIDYGTFGVGIKTTFDTYFNDFERLTLISPKDYLIGRDKFLKNHLGELDGKVSRRACKSILSAAETAR